jgi:IclR family KDG regulon transcriptional repressor
LFVKQFPQIVVSVKVGYTVFMENNNQPPTKPNKNQETTSVQAVDRALMLLKLIGDSDVPLSIVDLVDRTRLNRTTVWRLLMALENHRLIERDMATKGYQIGYAASRLGTGRAHYGPLIRRARAIMERLRQKADETVLLSVPKYFGVLTIDQINPAQSVRLVDYVDTVLPLHCTSNGKILLSRLPKEELNIMLQQPLDKLTSETITNPERLREEIDRVRERGFGTAIGELDENENGVSAPIVDKRNEVIAIISVSGPNFRLTKQRVLELGPELIVSAQEIADRLEE